MPSDPSSKHVLIVGAGPAGLTAGYELAKAGVPVTILEADPEYVGGISRTVEYHGYRFDIGGHRFFSKSEEIRKLWDEILAPEVMIKVPRLSRIYYAGKFFSYPLKPFEALRQLGIVESVRIMASYLWARCFPIRPVKSFADWVSNHFGKRLFRIFFKTYTEKVWGMSCDDISADWAAQRIKGLSLTKAVLSSLFPSKSGEGAKSLINEFSYPPLGPGMMWQACREKIERLGGKVILNAKVTGLQLQQESNGPVWTARYIQGDQTQTITGTHVICSAPLRDAVQGLTPPPPPAVLAASQALKYRDFLTVVLIMKERQPLQDNWIYIHDPGVMVGRIQNYRAWSPFLVPQAGTVCYGLEYFCFEHDGLWNQTNQELIALACREIAIIGLAEPSDFIDATVVRQPKAYPVYDETYTTHVRTIRASLDQNYPNLSVVGRNGMHMYNNQDHSMMTALCAARNIIADKPIWNPWAVNQDAEYHEEGQQTNAQAVSGLRLVPTKVAP